MARSSLSSIVSRYLSSLLFSLLVLTCIAHCAPTPAGQSVAPTPIDYNVTLERYSLVSRVTGIRQDWFNTIYPNVWAGKVSCQHIHPNGLQSFGAATARNAYESMLVDVATVGGGRVDNVIATLCIPGLFCWVASIPARWGPANQWVAQMMHSVPQWLAAYGPQNANSEYHSEDLTLALAAHDGVRYPYSVQIAGVTVNAVLNVYGLYDLSWGPSPAMDRYGPAGVRWPCVSASPNTNGRSQPCSSVLTRLGINFIYCPY